MLARHMVAMTAQQDQHGPAHGHSHSHGHGTGAGTGAGPGAGAQGNARLFADLEVLHEQRRQARRLLRSAEVAFGVAPAPGTRPAPPSAPPSPTRASASATLAPAPAAEAPGRGVASRLPLLDGVSLADLSSFLHLGPEVSGRFAALRERLTRGLVRTHTHTHIPTHTQHTHTQQR